jgi:pyruvate-ferredoxin/flavodoxin oxidoreductase
MSASAKRIVADGNEAAASVAYRASEVIAIYPITPSSTMGELSDEWASRGRPNLWGAVPDVVEMQSEGGAAGAIHGALQAGALATTFTASQGLLLMIPNMYKIAGELTSFCMHVTARALATHALSIFGDHSDVMACRQTGFAMLSSGSVQEAQDFAAVAHAATLRARIPFLHFFDGFRTSHEVTDLAPIADDDLRALLDDAAIAAHRARALSPDHPVLRGTAQNPDVFFQAREAANPFYLACPGIVREMFARLAERTGRRYDLFEYAGHPEAERVIVIMGSGGETAAETARFLAGRRDRVGVVRVRLYRPFAAGRFLAALPRSVKRIAVLDRTKEPGALGDPLYLDIVAALEAQERSGPRPEVVGGRYGLGSKEFTPAMVKAVFDEMRRDRPRARFTVGIHDDVTHASLPVERDFDIEPPATVRAIFYGLGSDGTVGANKASVKILAEDGDRHAQGYFVYDSKKSGAVTVSHLRFGPDPIRAPYLLRRASFTACHLFGLLEKRNVLEHAEPGSTLLLNAPYPVDEVFARLPPAVQEAVIERGLRVFAIDAAGVAEKAGLGRRINSVMQTCFFALSNVLPREEAIERIKASVRKIYARKGEGVVRANIAAIDAALDGLHEVPVPERVLAGASAAAARIPASAPAFVRDVTGPILAGNGDWLPVSAFPPDGTWPTGTAAYEKRGLATDLPVWDTELCIQCNKCALVCPHAAIRATLAPEEALAGAPDGLAWTPFKTREHDLAGLEYLLQVAPDDCTSCSLCMEACPAVSRDGSGRRALEMRPAGEVAADQRAAFAFFDGLPPVDPAKLAADVKGSQLREPLFEFSGACAGCGETPYVKLLTQLFGDRALIANATGCSSIFGGNLPTTPYTTNREGRGPAWSNSLFEDNAEFGLGFRLAADRLEAQARALVETLRAGLDPDLVRGLLDGDQGTDAGIAAQRERVRLLRIALPRVDHPDARRLETLADSLVKKSVWIVGGDGWAYDIGFGGLDHVLSLGRKVNILVLDTEVYSNTGGQRSKATPLGAAARFAAAGKAAPKKDLALMAMSYGSVYVARVALGAKDAQAVKAFTEAESYPGPSLIIAMSPCIAHGYEMSESLEHQKRAVACGAWPLLRYDPRRTDRGEAPLVLDSPAPTGDVLDYARGEARFREVEQRDPARFAALMGDARRDLAARHALYGHLARFKPGGTA